MKIKTILNIVIEIEIDDPYKKGFLLLLLLLYFCATKLILWALNDVIENGRIWLNMAENCSQIDRNYHLNKINKITKKKERWIEEGQNKF